MRHIMTSLMEEKEKIAYIIGSLLVFVGAYAGRDLTDMSELIEGSAILALFLSIFIVLVYTNRRGIGEWHDKYNSCTLTSARAPNHRATSVTALTT